MKFLAFLFVVVAALAFADANPPVSLWTPAVPTVVKTIQPVAVVAPAPVLIGKPLLANGWAGNAWAGNSWGGKAILG